MIPWEHLCDVDVSELVAWLESARPTWSQPVSPTKPQRIFSPPAHLVGPVVEAVLHAFARPVRSHDVILSRMGPDQAHPYHVDRQRPDWVTRVHVPLLTNPHAWMLFEGGDPVHFEAGKAYSFDTTHRHAFGNDGPTERVHLIFDVLEVDP